MMKRLIPFLAALLCALPAAGAARWNPSIELTPGGCATFYFGASDAGNVQPSINVRGPGELAFTSIATNGTAMSVSFYAVLANSANPATDVGTRLLYTAVGNSSSPVYNPVNDGYVLDVDVDTDGDGGSVAVCFAGYAETGNFGTPGFVVSAMDAAFDVVANFDTRITRFASGELRQYSNECQQAQEAYNPVSDVSTADFSDWSIKYTGTLDAVWADFYDAGPQRNCLLMIPSSSVPGAQGTGGYSLNDAARTGWPELQTRIVAAGFGARTLRRRHALHHDRNGDDAHRRHGLERGLRPERDERVRRVHNPVDDGCASHLDRVGQCLLPHHPNGPRRARHRPSARRCVVER
jgi:hypothetical protein